MKKKDHSSSIPVWFSRSAGSLGWHQTRWINDHFQTNACDTTTSVQQSVCYGDGEGKEEKGNQ